jgi:hypothetical protein
LTWGARDLKAKRRRTFQHVLVMYLCGGVQLSNYLRHRYTHQNSRGASLRRPAQLVLAVISTAVAKSSNGFTSYRGITGDMISSYQSINKSNVPEAPLRQTVVPSTSPPTCLEPICQKTACTSIPNHWKPAGNNQLAKADDIEQIRVPTFLRRCGLFK